MLARGGLAALASGLPVFFLGSAREIGAEWGRVTPAVTGGVGGPLRTRVFSLKCSGLSSEWW